MSLLTSVVLALALVATLLAVLRLFDVRRLLSVDESLVLTDTGPRAVFAFATHYLFSVFLLCVTATTTESSVFLEVQCDTASRITRLASFSGLVLATLIFFA